MISDINPPVRYTSYHSDKTFSILEDARGRISRGGSTFFEYNGLDCRLGGQYQRPVKPGVLELTASPMCKYLTPIGCEREQEVFVQFDGDKFEEFIETFEIEGKTVKWILEHQKSWKYKFSAKHLEETLAGFSFWFIYRGLPCTIYQRCFTIWPARRFDVTQYAPVVPGAEHWFYDAARKQDIFSLQDGETTAVGTIECGMFKTDGELLDCVQLNNKTLREIFDTEYDDGAVCSAAFDG
ncbi:MAG: hypothetical protein METHP_01477 [Methanoregula sp. SKADARSKE-2]|nr:MAG: hypothetical protein METHP_01477 [Methanoregula sp. SKADARSKE-2]